MKPLLIGAVAVWPLAAALHGQTPPIDPPPPGPVLPLPLAQPQEALLPNGLRLVVIEQHRQPVLSVRLSMPAGHAFDPQGKEGLADIYAALLTRGAGQRSAREMATTVENIGGTMGAAAGPDHLLLQADVVSAHAALAFELIGDAVLRPSLNQADVDRLRAETYNALIAGLEDPGSLAARVFLLGAYGNHPYGRRPSPASVQSISRTDLEAFGRARIRPAGSILVLAGDITLAEARRLATQYLGAWKGLRPPMLTATGPTPAQKEILLVHAGGIQNANLLVGGTTFPGNDTSYYAVAVLSQILGASPSGRLAQALTQGRSWSAASGASFLRTARLGLFQATVAVPVEAADSALRAVYAELARLRADPVSAGELDRARESIAGSYALRLQTASQFAGAMTEARVFGLPPSFLSTYRSRILAVTPAQVRAIARRLFPAQGVVTVVVGDAARLYRPLSLIGTVRLFAADGRPLTPEALEPKSLALALIPSQATRGADTLAVLAEGRSVGLQVTRLARSGDSLTYVEETVLGTMFSQNTTLSFDTAGRMRSLSQTGKSRGEDTRIELTYGNGRVRGQARVVAPDGPRSFAIDTTVSPTVIDDNGVQAILPLLPWDVHVRWSFEVFASAENSIRRLTLTSSDITRLTVPAGTFDCYRADLEGGPQRVSFFVSTKPPHRVIRIEVPNSPIEFVAVNP